MFVPISLGETTGRMVSGGENVKTELLWEMGGSRGGLIEQIMCKFPSNFYFYTTHNLSA